MRITSITVTDEAGVDHTWEGLDGFVRVAAVNAKKEPYRQAVDAHLVLSADPGVKA